MLAAVRGSRDFSSNRKPVQQKLLFNHWLVRFVFVEPLQTCNIWVTSYHFKFHQSFTWNHQQKLKLISGSDRGGRRSHVHSNRKTPATFPLKSSTLINFELQILSDWEQLFWGRTSIFRPDGSKELCPIFDLSSQLRVGRKLQGHCFNWGVTQHSAILPNQSSPRKLTHCLGNADADILVVASSHSFLTVSFWNVLTSLGLTCSSEGFAGLIWNTESSWWEIQPVAGQKRDRTAAYPGIYRHSLTACWVPLGDRWLGFSLFLFYFLNIVICNIPSSGEWFIIIM